MQFPRAWLRAPTSDDPEQQLRATVIHQLLLTALATIVPLTILIPIVEDEYAYTLPIYLVAVFAAALGFTILHLGWIRTAGAIVTIAGWLVTLWASFASGGLGSPQLSMGVLVLMLAGFLWSGAAAIGMAFVISGSLAGLEVLRDSGALPQPFIEASSFTVWAALSSVLALSAVMLQIFVNAMRAARDDAAAKTRLLREEMDRRVETEASLARAQKLEALGRLTGGIAHDFNNILTVLVAESEMLEESTASGRPLREEESEQIREIRASAHRASELTTQLLAFSRRQIGIPEVVGPDPCIERLEPMLSRLIREDVKLDMQLLAPKAQIRIDPSQLDQVVMNLVLNASDAMPRGGALAISTDRVDVDSSVARIDPTARQGPHVVIRVRDTGEGISPSDRERIFDPFFTTKGVGRGTGLGLATAHGIVSQAGGHIRVESTSDAGTTFEIFLPEVEAAQESARREILPPRDPAITGTVLLCEDDEAVRRSTRRTLMVAGHEVIDVESAEAALEWLKGDRRVVDLLISDVILPGMNGAQLAREAVELCPGLKVLLISGYTAGVLKDSGIPPDVELLEKPFKPDVLLDKVAARLSV